MSSDLQPPKYRHHKARNLACVRISGKDIYLGRYGSPESLELYQSHVARWKADQAATKVRKLSQLHVGPTIDQVIKPYLEHVRGDYPQGG